MNKSLLSRTLAAVLYPERGAAVVEHIDLFRWAEEASQEAVDGALADLRGLRGKIAGVVDVSCGANFSDRAKGHTHDSDRVHL